MICALHIIFEINAVKKTPKNVWKNINYNLKKGQICAYIGG
jgi:hypothetical protein